MEKTKFQSYVEKLKADNLTTYKQWKRITSDFRIEKETTKSYNGRQLLELLQNADDAKTNEVLIEIDKENQILSISNNGLPFTVNEGISSLMIANTSSKRKEFIGNKGLGFRSILNWVSVVKIKTKTDVVEFSREIANSNFNNLSKEFQNFLFKDNEERLDQNEIPFAILSIPEIYDNNINQDFITRIELKYLKNKEADIINQLKMIDSKILLFLNHTKKITIRNSKSKIDCSFKKNKSVNNNTISINENTWNIKDSGEVLYKTDGDKKKYYNYKIAWQDNLKDNDSRFFTFFPTQVSTHLPYLIHGTFDLDLSRNYLNNSEGNKILLNKIADAIGEIAVTQIRKEKSDWLAYKFLSTNSNNDNPLLNTFFENIEEKKANLDVYPCVDGRYRKISDVLFFGNEFSKFIIENELQNSIKNLLLIIPESTGFQFNYNQNNLSKEDFKVIVHNISEEILLSKSKNLRARYITILTHNQFNKYHNTNYKLLINNKGELISENTTVFTPSSGDEIVKPDFVDIDIINKELYTELINILEYSFDSKEPKSRELQRIIRIIVNIQPYDITNITKRIISKSKEIIKVKNKEDSIAVVKQMVLKLYINRLKGGNTQESPDESIPLLNKNLDVVESDFLYIGVDYNLGKVYSEIFEGIYDDKDYVAGNDVWEFENKEELESFFKWLNLDCYLKQEEYNNRDNKFENYVFSKVERPKNITNIDVSGKKIRDENTLSKLSIEKLMWLVVQNQELQNKLFVNHGDSFKYKYIYFRVIENAPSYIEYQIHKSHQFNSIIIDSSVSDLMPQNFNFNSILFEEQIEQVKSNLIKLGAKKTFNDAEPEFVYQLLKNISTNEEYEKGKGSQQIYKKIFDYFSKNENTKLKDFKIIFDGLSYYARMGGKGKDFVSKPYSEVYYSDNKIVPQNVLDNYWILYLPKRLGEEKVKKFFGVNLVKEILKNTKINKVVTSKINNEFNEYLKKLKPYILYYRLLSIKNENKKDAVNIIKNIDIELVLKCEYSFNGNDKIELEENGFIKIGSKFYIKNKSTSIRELKRNIAFPNAIAEILNTQFKIKEYHDEFRNILYSNIKDIEYIITDEDGDALLEDAKKLLGVSNFEIQFWKKIIKEIQSSENVEKKEYKSRLEKLLNEKLPDYYDKIDFSDFNNREGVNFLVWLKQIKEFELKDVLPNQGLISWYKNKFSNILKDYFEEFEKKYWNKVNVSKNIIDKENYFKETILYDNMVENNKFTDLLDKNKYNLEYNVELAFIGFIKNKYSIILKKEHENIKKVKNLYINILKKYNIGADIDDLEKIIKEKYPKMYSLLFFEGYDNEIIEVLNKLKEETENNRNNTNEENIEISNLTITFSNLTKKTPSTNSNNNSNNSYSHTSTQNSHKTRAGKREENKVVKALKFNGYKVRNIAKRTDSKHYDLEYKKKESSEWRFLEVKKDSGGFFYLSSSEKETALKKENSDKYDVAVVNGNNIHIIKSPFLFDKETFENNSNFTAVPSEYKLSFKIKENQETTNLL